MTEERYTTYEALKNDPNVPKSRGEMIGRGVKAVLKDFSENFRKRIVTLLIIAAAVFLFNLLLVSFDRSNYLRSYDTVMGQISNYFLCVKDLSTDRKGFSYKDGNNYREIFSLVLVMVVGITGFVKRWKQVKGAVFKDIPAAFAVHKSAVKQAAVPELKAAAKGAIFAFVIGFLLKNPIALVFAALFALGDVGRGRESQLFTTVFWWKATGNMKKKDAPSLREADTELEVFWFALGLAVYAVLAIIIWNVFNYNVWARAILSLGLAGLFYYLGYVKKGKASAAANILAFVFLNLALWYVLGGSAEARRHIDTTEAGRQAFGKRRRTPPQLQTYVWEGQQAAEPSFLESAWAVVSAAATQVWSSVTNFFTNNAATGIEGAHNIYNAKDEGNLAMGQAAYHTVMDQVGLGGVADAAGGIDSAMNGSESGGNGGGKKK